MKTVYRWTAEVAWWAHLVVSSGLAAAAIWLTERGDQ